MLTLFFVLIVAAGIGYVVTTPEEHVRALALLRQYTKPLRAEIERCQVATAPFREVLRTRTPWVVVTPTIVGLNVAVFILMGFGEGPVGAPATMVAWGGSIGPRTTNGEWWRLVTAVFVHSGVLHLLATCAGLAQIGRMLERLVGPFMFACVYVAAGAFTNLARTWETPLVVHGGATGSIFGIYGLLLGVTVWGLIRRTGVRVPLMAFRALAPTAAVFLLYSVVTDGLSSMPNFAGFVVGLAGGLVLTKDVNELKPEPHPTAVALTASAIVVLTLGLPLRGQVDVGPQIAQVVAIEEQTIGPYRAAVDRYRKGRIKVQALTELINGTIMPQLHDARLRVEALDGVLVEHKQLVGNAAEYLRLREDSWRLRAEALRAGSTEALREADRAERVSLGELEKLRHKTRILEARTKLRTAGA